MWPAKSVVAVGVREVFDSGGGDTAAETLRNEREDEHNQGGDMTQQQGDGMESVGNQDDMISTEYEERVLQIHLT
ncbi:MAG: hypothetical protein KGP14_07645, partial [Betaproteobacteria bacterium]|nr:hypothetical protein [Betaproteobacteria bacterium]